MSPIHSLWQWEREGKRDAARAEYVAALERVHLAAREHLYEPEYLARHGKYKALVAALSDPALSTSKATR